VARCKTSVVILVLLLASGALIHSTLAGGPATQPATQPLTDDQVQMQAAWDDLAKSEPFCSKALLDMSAKPDAAVEFLKANLKPLKLERAELDQLLKDLGSDDEKVWKAAFDKMKYFDPRLAATLDELLEAAPDQPAHNRLIALLAGQDPEKCKDKDITLRQRGGDYAYFQVPMGNQSWTNWGVSLKVSQLDVTDGYSQKKPWLRADRAIVLLQHIGTPAAISILKDMAAGNPDALPTKIAKLAVKSLTEASAPK
jgi:hypothetical protein